MRYGRWLAVLATGMAASGLIGLTASLASAHGFQDDDRLLPGSTVAGVDVGEQRAEAAIEDVRAHLEPQLDEEIELRADEHRWTTSAAELDATPDVEGAVSEAVSHTRDAGLVELSLLRIRGDAADIDVEVDRGADGDAVDRLVATIAEEIDREPRDATLDWDGERIAPAEEREGRVLDRSAARERIGSGVVTGEDVDLPVEPIEPTVTREELVPVAEHLSDLVTDTLDRDISLTAAGTERSVTVRELGVELDLEQLLEHVVGGTDGVPSEAALPETPADLPLDVPDTTISELVDDLATDVKRPTRDAELDWSTGELQVVEGQTGRHLDADAAHARIVEAVRDGTDHLDLEVQTTSPTVTTDDYEQVLFLRIDDRTLELHEDGELLRTWPVAVGQPGSPTPTGVFTVGNKRVDPTWTNPAPDGWGSDMPDVVGPGPDNPLGVRAINWNRDGADTLIRFHGTNEPDSIGQAASRGCVRLLNRDVVELYDLVDRGTTIVATAG